MSRWRRATLASGASCASAASAAATAASGDTGARECAAQRSLMDDMAALPRVTTSFHASQRAPLPNRLACRHSASSEGRCLHSVRFEQIDSWSSLYNLGLCTFVSVRRPPSSRWHSYVRTWRRVSWLSHSQHSADTVHDPGNFSLQRLER